MTTDNEGHSETKQSPVSQLLQASPECLRLRGRKYLAGLFHGVSIGILMAAATFRDLPVGLASLAGVLILLGWSLLRPVECQIARLRVVAGEFSEKDIDTIFRQGVSLERQGDARRAAIDFQLVAENSADPENVRLARECLQRLGTLRR